MLCPPVILWASLLLSLGGLLPSQQLHHISASAQGEDGTTFIGTGSYAVYPPSLFTPVGVAKVSFRTSEANGLLLYLVPNNDTSNYFIAHLDEGKLRINLQATRSFFGVSLPFETIKTFGENLNDNQRHSVTFTSTTEGEINVTLDGDEDRITYSTDDDPATFILHSSVYVGGLADISPINLLNTLPNFIGCVEEVRLSNDSSLQALETVIAVMEDRLRGGCVEPNCSLAPCSNGGRCLPRWPDGECDCSSSLQVGATCTEDPSSHQLIQNTSSFSCFTVAQQPYLSATVNTATFRLLNPLPNTGSILTAVSKSGDFFQFYLENHALVFEYFDAVGNKTAVYSKDLPEINEDTYQIDFNQTTSEVVMAISQVLSSDEVELIESESVSVLGLLNVVHFDTICIGGVIMELPYYSGVLERVLYNHFSLTEERNFDTFQRSSNSRSNFISFTNASLTPWPVFERFTFETSRRISFEIRVPLNGRGHLLEVNNAAEMAQYLLAIFNGDLTISLGSAELPRLCGLGSGYLNDNEWHWIVVDIIIGDSLTRSEIHHTIDGTQHCSISGGEDFRQDLLAILSTPLEFGSSSQGENGVSFVGCMQNLVFELKNGGEIFRPNLEALALVKERFEVSEGTCFACAEGNGGVCGEMEDSNGFPGGNDGGEDTVCTQAGFGCATLCEEYLQQECSLPTVMTPMTETEPETTPTIITATLTQTTPTIGTTPTQTTPTSAPTTNETTTTSDKVGKQIGIALGVVIGTVIIMAILVVMAMLVYQSVVKKRGYYATNENKGSDAPVLHYSASLRQISSETVPHEQNLYVTSNGSFSPSTSNNVPAKKPDKEFYM